MDTLKDITEEVIEIEGKLVYNRARIMKRAHALVKKGIEYNFASALRRAWESARKQMEKAIVNKKSEEINKNRKDIVHKESDFKDEYKPKFFTI